MICAVLRMHESQWHSYIDGSRNHTLTLMLGHTRTEKSGCSDSGLSLPDGSPLPDGSRACALPDQSLPDGSRAHRACVTLRHCRQRNTIASYSWWKFAKEVWSLYTAVSS